MKAREVTEKLPKAPRSGESLGVEARDLRGGYPHAVAHELLEVLLHGPSILKQEPDLVVAKNQARIMHNEMKREEKDAAGASQPQIAPRGTGNGQILAGGSPYDKHSTLGLNGSGLAKDCSTVAGKVPDIPYVASSRCSGVATPLVRIRVAMALGYHGTQIGLHLGRNDKRRWVSYDSLHGPSRGTTAIKQRDDSVRRLGKGETRRG